MKRRFQVGDVVREVDGKAIGTVVHIMKDADLIVVNFHRPGKVLPTTLMIW